MNKMLHILQDHYRHARNFYDSRIKPEQSLARQYYLRHKTIAPHEVGRSGVISSEVFEAVEQVIPHLHKVFSGHKQIITYHPRKLDDDGLYAEQESAYLNYLFFEENDGFAFNDAAFRQALLYKNAVAKICFEYQHGEAIETYQDLDHLSLLALQQDESLILEDLQENPVGIYHVRVRRQRVEEGIKFYILGPDEFLIDPHARSLDQAQFVAHVANMDMDAVTASFSLSLDQQKSLIDKVRDKPLDHVVESFGHDPDSPRDLSKISVPIIEAYVKADFDGNGQVSWNRIIGLRHGGQISEILHQSLVDDHPFAAWTAFPQPQSFYGSSLADLVQQTQAKSTAIQRQILDHLYLQNHCRLIVNPAKVKMEDLQSSKPHQIIATRNGNSLMEGDVTPLNMGSIPSETFGFLNRLDQEKSDLLGVSSQASLSLDDLKNTSAQVVQEVAQQGRLRLELFARYYAEFLKKVFRKASLLLRLHASMPKIMRLYGKVYQINPKTWDLNFDMSVEVGLGTLNKQDKIAQLMSVLDLQKQALSMGLCHTGHVFQTLQNLCRYMDLPNPYLYFQEPALVPEQSVADVVPDPSIAFAFDQLGLEKSRLELKAQEMILDYELKHKELALKYGQDISADANSRN